MQLSAMEELLIRYIRSANFQAAEELYRTLKEQRIREDKKYLREG